MTIYDLTIGNNSEIVKQSSRPMTEIFDILTHKTVSKDFKSYWVDYEISITAESMSIFFCLWRFADGIEKVGESKLGRQVDALALGGDEGRDKLR